MLLFMYVLWHKSLLCINISSGMFPSLYMYPFKDSVNISATILRLHKDFFVLDLFGSCLLAAHANSGFILRKIWGRLQTVVTFWGIEMLEDWHLSYHFKLFDIITIRLWHWFKCQSYRISFPRTSTSPVLFPKSLQLIFWAVNKQNSWR